VPIYANGRDTSLRIYGANPGAGDVGSKHLRLESPTPAGEQDSFYTENGFTLSRMVAAIRGSGGPSVTWTVKFAATRDAVGTEVKTGGVTTTDPSNGSSIILFDNAAIPADSFVWLEVTATAGTVDELDVTLIPTLV
jgi:hypothetical protein